MPGVLAFLTSLLASLGFPSAPARADAPAPAHDPPTADDDPVTVAEPPVEEVVCYWTCMALCVVTGKPHGECHPTCYDMCFIIVPPPGPTCEPVDC